MNKKNKIKSKLIQELLIHKTYETMNAVIMVSKIESYNKDYISIKNIFRKEKSSCEFSLNFLIEKRTNNIYIYSNEINPIQVIFNSFLTNDFISDTVDISYKLKEISDKWNIFEDLIIDPRKEVGVVASDLSRHSKILSKKTLRTQSDTIMKNFIYNKLIFKNLKYNVKMIGMPNIYFKDGNILSKNSIKLDLYGSGFSNLYLTEVESYSNIRELNDSREFAYKKFNLFCKSALIKELNIFYENYDLKSLSILSEKDLIEMSKCIELINY